MGDKRTKSVRGMTLLEVLVATVVISVSAAGVLSYEYHAAGEAKRASVYAGAVRVGSFLLDDWKANGGSTLYASSVDAIYGNNQGHNDGDIPSNSDMVFMSAGAGVYKLTLNGIPMQVELSRLEGAVSQRLVPLRVTVRWRRDFADAVIDNATASRPVILNALARVDQAGG